MAKILTTMHVNQGRVNIISAATSSNHIIFVSKKHFNWFLRNPQNSSQKQLDKIQKKLEAEKKQNEMYDKFTSHMTKDQPYFSQSLFYGHQQNQFPKRQDHLKEQIKEDIERQRAQVLTLEQYHKVQQQFKDKGVKRVPFFIADDKTMHLHFVLMSFSRLICIFNLGYLGIAAYTYAFSKLLYPNFLYLCSAGITCMNGIFTYYLFKFRKTAISRLEWDVNTEQFVIVKPKGVMGETQKFMPTNELIMNNKSKERDCIYFDGQTGVGLATVNRGQWYNMMLFMHIMLRHQKKGAQSNQGKNNSKEQSEDNVF